MKSVLSRRARACVIGFALLPITASAGDWQPLAIGSRWEYRGTGTAHQVQTITGQTTIRDRVVAVKRYAEGADAGLENYWLLDPNGSVLLAGFHNPSAELALAYEPPITYLLVPPTVGEAPQQAVGVYDLFTNTFCCVILVAFYGTGYEVLNLPAGTFTAFGVATVPVPGPAFAARPALTLDGRKLTGSSPSIDAVDPTDWYSEGVGVVQYSSDDLYRLVGYGLPTATVSTTWGAIKQRFR
jgi:hypothetical protein